LQDVTLRLLTVLQSVDLIAAEDTRHTRKLLTHFDIHQPLTSLHEHNERQKSGELVDKLLQGQSVALVSDAGMPGVSDPGTVLVQAAIQSGIPVTVVPGPSAALAGLVISGLDTNRFVFVGFPPRGKAERKALLSDLQALPFTLVFYEAPHRLRALLADMAVLYRGRQAAVARELTKQYESVQRGTVEELLTWFTADEPRGEFVVLVEGNSTDWQAEDSAPNWDQALEEVYALVEQGEEASAAIKLVARKQKLSRRELYNLYHQSTPLA
jgi:16S rRNA (cytidine1402-2'-O)-methyltransferase